jgi:hypothetical protein
MFTPEMCRLTARRRVSRLPFKLVDHNQDRASRSRISGILRLYETSSPRAALLRVLPTSKVSTRNMRGNLGGYQRVGDFEILGVSTEPIGTKLSSLRDPARAGKSAVAPINDDGDDVAVSDWASTYLDRANWRATDWDSTSSELDDTDSSAAHRSPVYVNPESSFPDPAQDPASQSVDLDAAVSGPSCSGDISQEITSASLAGIRPTKILFSQLPSSSSYTTFCSYPPFCGSGMSLSLLNHLPHVCLNRIIRRNLRGTPPDTSHASFSLNDQRGGGGDPVGGC